MAKLYFSSYDHEAISVADMYVFLSPMMSVIFRLCVSNITSICYIVYLTQKPRRAMATKNIQVQLRTCKYNLKIQFKLLIKTIKAQKTIQKHYWNRIKSSHNTLTMSYNHKNKPRQILNANKTHISQQQENHISSWCS